MPVRALYSEKWRTDLPYRMETLGKLPLIRYIRAARKSHLRFESYIVHQAKRHLLSQVPFCNEINPHAWICEMRVAREIRLRRVKCLRA